MSTFELRRRELAFREDAETEADVVSDAIDAGILEDGDEVSVYPADDLPVGWDGTDPEEPE